MHLNILHKAHVDMRFAHLIHLCAIILFSFSTNAENLSRQLKYEQGRILCLYAYAELYRQSATKDNQQRTELERKRLSYIHQGINLSRTNQSKWPEAEGWYALGMHLARSKTNYAARTKYLSLAASLSNKRGNQQTRHRH